MLDQKSLELALANYTVYTTTVERALDPRVGGSMSMVVGNYCIQRTFLIRLLFISSLDAYKRATTTSTP